MCLSSTNDSLPKAGHVSEKSGSKIPRSAHSSWQYSVVRIWGFVIICCLIATGMILSLALILHSRQGQPLPSLPYHISVNAVVSILVTIARACILVALAEGLGQLKWQYFRKRRPLQHFVVYDLASRGPWGCLRLIFSLRGRNLIATLGALVMVLSIPLDAFTQHLIRYYPCAVPANNGSVAVIPRASIYTEYGLHTGAGLFQITTGQLGSISGAMFNPGAVSIPFTCSTGNCGFNDTYATTAYCTECQDVTDELRTFWVNKTVLYNVNGGQGSSYITSPNGTIQYDNGTVIYGNGTRIDQGPLWKNETTSSLNTTLPSGLWTSRTYGGNDPYFSMFAYTSGGPSNSIYPMPGGPPVMTIEMILGDFGPYANIFGLDCDSEWGKQTWGCLGKGAARCNLTPCVQSYTAQIDAGVLTESTPDEYTDWWLGRLNNTSDPLLVMADTACTSEEGKQSLKDRGLNISNSRFIPYDIGIDYESGNLTQLCSAVSDTGLCEINRPLSMDELSIIPKNCIYEVDGFAAAAIETFVIPYFNVTAYTAANGDAFVGDPQAPTILNNTAVSFEAANKTFQAIGQALSVRMRQWDWDGTGESNDPKTGTAYMTTTCIDIRWPWLIYPVILAALTLVFFFATLFRTEVAGAVDFARGWKNSPLPLIYHGIDGVEEEEDEVDDSRRLGDIFAMESSTKRATRFVAHSSGLER